MHTTALQLRAERIKISRRATAIAAAALISAGALSACGDSDTPTSANERATSTTKAAPQTTQSGSNDLGPLETVDDFVRAAKMVGEVYAPCGAQPLQVNECIDADKQASPLMSEITASATSKGWILVVTAVREGTAAASFLTTSCARDLTPMDKVFVDCVDAQQSMTFLAEDLEVASYKSDQVK